MGLIIVKSILSFSKNNRITIHCSESNNWLSNEYYIRILLKKSTNRKSYEIIYLIFEFLVVERKKSYVTTMHFHRHFDILKFS